MPHSKFKCVVEHTQIVLWAHTFGPDRVVLALNTRWCVAKHTKACYWTRLAILPLHRRCVAVTHLKDLRCVASLSTFLCRKRCVISAHRCVTRARLSLNYTSSLCTHPAAFTIKHSSVLYTHPLKTHHFGNNTVWGYTPLNCTSSPCTHLAVFTIKHSSVLYTHPLKTHHFGKYT